MTPSDIEKSRKEFEEILKSTGELNDFGDDIFEHCEHSFYKNRVTKLVFLGWKLRQESLTVELPAMFHDSVRGYEADEMKSAIKSAGINYRERE